MAETVRTLQLPALGCFRLSPQQDFSGKTLKEVLAWCLVWLMAPELGIGPFLV